MSGTLLRGWEAFGVPGVRIFAFPGSSPRSSYHEFFKPALWLCKFQLGGSRAFYAVDLRKFEAVDRLGFYVKVQYFEPCLQKQTLKLCGKKRKEEQRAGGHRRKVLTAIESGGEEKC